MTMFEENKLKSSIDCRQNLVNYFEVGLDPNYKPRPAIVDLKEEMSVKNYFMLTTARLESIKNYLRISGNSWQKERLWIGLRK